MNQIALFTTTLVTLLLSASVCAGGPADKVTGDFTIVGCYQCVPGDPLGIYRYRDISAHEAAGKRFQKGHLFSWQDNDAWYQMNFRDTENTCVHVYAEGAARIGGLVSDGNVGAVGKYFGYDILDGGQPDPELYVDTMWVIRFDGADPKADFFFWCETGTVVTATWWPQAVIEGNVKVHNYKYDGD